MWNYKLLEGTLGTIYFTLFTLHIKNLMPGETKGRFYGDRLVGARVKPRTLVSGLQVQCHLAHSPHCLLWCKSSQPGKTLPFRRQCLETVLIVRT